MFPILISELVKESILTKETGASVSKQFQNGSAVINAALDLYDLNNDMAQLVENLMKAAASK